MSGERPVVPYGVTATGVQRALGERRKRRMAERGGQVDLDATMSSWPTPDPPTRPRPVVRPRPPVPGAAQRPVQATPAAIALGELVEHAPRSITRPEADDSSRRTRRRGPAPTETVSRSGADPFAPAPATVTPSFAPPPPVPAVAPRDDAATRPAFATPAEPAAPPRRAEATGPFAIVPPPQRPGARAATRVAQPLAAPSARAAARVASPVADPAGAGSPAVATPIGGSSPVSRPGPALAGAAPRVARAPATSVDPLSPFGGGPRIAPTPVPGTSRSAAPAMWARSAMDEPPVKRQWWRSVPALAVTAAILVAVLVGVAVLFTRQSTEPAAALQPPSDAPRQETVLVAVLAEDGSIADATLLALDSESLVSLAVPGALLTTVSDSGAVPLSQTVKIDPDAPVRGVEDTLGVRVDGTWVMDRTILADLVGPGGGVVVDVATQVIDGDVTIPAGPEQRLTGTQAVSYALADIEGESAEAALARFNQVILGLLAGMPTDPDEVTQVISATERNAATTITSEDLTTLIAGAAERIAAGRADPITVPTAVAEPGDSTVNVDAAAMEAVATRALAGAELPVAVVGPLRVSVQDGVGVSGLATAARERLVAGGFRYVGGGVAQDVSVAQSVILVPSDTPENRTRGEAVARALGLPENSLAVPPPDQATADVDIIVVVGQDFADLVESGSP